MIGEYAEVLKEFKPDKLNISQKNLHLGKIYKKFEFVFFIEYHI